MCSRITQFCSQLAPGNSLTFPGLGHFGSCLPVLKQFFRGNSVPPAKRQAQSASRAWTYHNLTRKSLFDTGIIFSFSMVKPIQKCRSFFQNCLPKSVHDFKGCPSHTNPSKWQNTRPKWQASRVREMILSFAGHFDRRTMNPSPDILRFRRTFMSSKKENLHRTFLTFRQIHVMEKMTFSWSVLWNIMDF